MKKNKRLFLTLSVVVAAVFVSSGQSPYVHNTFIAIPCSGTGPLPFAEFEIMQTMDELNAYLSKSGCDTSQLAELPDFSHETAIGLVTGYCSDHHTSCSHSPEGVVYKNDTLALIVHSGSSVDSTRILPLGFSTMLITLEKNGQVPLVMREYAPPVAAVKPQRDAPAAEIAYRATMGLCDILGRSLENGTRYTSGIAIRINENGTARRMFVGSRNPSVR